MSNLNKRLIKISIIIVSSFFIGDIAIAQNRYSQQRVLDQMWRTQRDSSQRIEQERVRRAQQEQIKNELRNAMRNQQEQMRKAMRDEQEKMRQGMRNQQELMRRSLRDNELSGKSPRSGTPSSIVNKTADRITFKNGISKITKPLTASEIKRGFTGKYTEDNRPLVKIQNRVFAIPSSRAGFQQRRTETAPAALSTNWSKHKLISIKNDIQKLANQPLEGGKKADSGVPNTPSVQTRNGNKLLSPVIQARIDEAKKARGSPESAKPIMVTAKGVAITPELLAKQGTSSLAGNFKGLKGATIDEITARVPSDWKIKPQEMGRGIKYVDPAGYERIRIHGPTKNAPNGSNSASGWTMRIMDRSGKYYDNEGNVVPYKSNDGHIPINGNPALGDKP